MESTYNEILELDSISKHYGNYKVLENISFKVRKNSVNIIIGPNSAGKSTLAKIISGIDKPSSGSIMKPSNIVVNYLPQKTKINPYLPFTSETMFDYIVDNAQIENQAVIDEIKDFCCINTNSKKQVVDLSGGTLQKLLIGATLARKSDLIILDEPTQHLDVNAEKMFYKLIMLMKKELGTTFIMISHDIHTVLKFADKIICLNNHVCCTGSPEEFEINDPFLSLYKHHHNHSH